MTIVFNGTTGIETPGVTNSGSETIAGTLQVGGVTTNIYPLVSGTAVTVSGTSVDFTGIPSTAKRITVMFAGVSTSGTSAIIIQLGDSGGIETTSYAGTSTNFTSSNLVSTNITTGLGVTASMVAAWVLQGAATINLFDSATNTWVSQSVTSAGGATFNNIGSGSKALSGTLDRVRITTVNGTDTFDVGTINIMWE